MNPIREALYGALSGDETLTGLLATPTSIYDSRAPQGAARPYVILSRQSSVVAARGFAVSSVDNDLWLVKAVDAAASATKAEQIDQAIAGLLDGSELEVTGRDSLWVARETGVRYIEDDDQQTIWHIGGSYRLIHVADD